MKYFISIANVTHMAQINSSIFEVVTESQESLFESLFEKISELNSAPQMLHRFIEILKSLNEQEILNYSLYNETSKDCPIDSYAYYETIINKTENSLTIELHRFIDELSGNSFKLSGESYYTHSIVLQIIITD